MSSENHAHPFGTPVNVFKFGEGDQFIIDNLELDKMFLHPDVKDRKVVVFSIIGAFRRGKSFFLDYCLRFMYANYPSINNRENPLKDDKEWIGADTEPLKGFSWRSGTKRDTIGVVMWSDVFLHTLKNTGEKIAIIIMDTQGLFDNETSPADNSRIFALASLISSIQILNLAGIIQEDQLQYLQFATEFAKFAAQDNHGEAGKPFQNLLFLIRDWGNSDEFEFGSEGGEEYLKSVLKVKPGQQPELKSVRQFISSSFEQLQCCLMPNPGKNVADAKNYDGQWKLMDEEFKDELANIIQNLLKPRNVVLKKINGKNLKGSEMNEYIKSYFTLFQSDTLPQAQSIYESTVDKLMNLLISKCLDSYQENIAKNQHLVEETNFHVFHDMSKSMTLIMFKDEKKMGNKKHEKKYKALLETQVEKMYVEWKDRSLKSIRQLKEEKQKTEDALKEKLRLELEALEAERKSKEKQDEHERQIERQKEEHRLKLEALEAERKSKEKRDEHERQMERQKEEHRLKLEALEAERKAKEKQDEHERQIERQKQDHRLKLESLEAERITKEKQNEHERQMERQKEEHRFKLEAEAEKARVARAEHYERNREQNLIASTVTTVLTDVLKAATKVALR